MSPSEIANVKKIIKDIKYKLNELERSIDKTPQKKFGYSNSNMTQQGSPRKRIVYGEPGNKKENK